MRHSFVADDSKRNCQRNDNEHRQRHFDIEDAQNDQCNEQTDQYDSTVCDDARRKVLDLLIVPHKKRGQFSCVMSRKIAHRQRFQLVTEPQFFILLCRDMADTNVKIGLSADNRIANCLH